MDAHAAVHPTEQTLSSFGLGKLEDASAEAVSKHLEQCPACRKRVAEMSADSFLGRIRDAQARPDSPVPVVSSLAGLSMMAGGTGSSARPPPETLPPGLADDPDYEVIRELGQGGMGVVYLAENRLMGRKEVLKVVSGHLINRRVVLERFLNEIRHAAQLHHPNIVTAYAALHMGESLVLAMEYVEGRDLAKLVKARGPLPVAHASNYAQQAALGLQHAHEHGMVHRDIKPGNLMLARQGNRAVVKVLDFGLAKVSREVPADGALTHEGQMLGTPDFIAPEQISDARRADIRADIYSLGCTLYYLLTGGPPFQGTSLYDILQAHHSRDALPLNLARPEVPVELAALVAKMMAKEPEQRFQEPKEVSRALTPFFKPGANPGARPSPEISRVGQAAPAPHLVGGGSAPAQLATLGAAPAPAPRGPSKPNPDGVAWEGLIEVRDTEPSKAMVKPKPEVALTPTPVRRPPWLWASVVTAVLTFGLFAAWMGGVFKVKTPEGVIVLENLPYASEILVDGNRITFTWPGAGKPLEIRAVPGQRRIEVKKDGFKAFVKEMTLQGDGPEEVTVRLEPLDAGEPEPDKTGAASAGQLKTWTNSVGMKFVRIEPGQFMMGSTDWEDEKPRHVVEISRPFCLSDREVTQRQYLEVTGVNPSQFKGSDELPVDQVSWLDAVSFCNKLSGKEGRTSCYRIVGLEVTVVEGNGYRLPTEAEWEYACRAGSTTRYPFGENAAELGEFAWFVGNAEGKPHPVGQKRPNRWGLYDMLGNVWEWCQDGKDAGYYAQSPRADPPGPFRASSRVVRGVCWSGTPEHCRPAARGNSTPESRLGNQGFRLAAAGGNGGSYTSAAESRSGAPLDKPSILAIKPLETVTNTFGMALSLIPAGEFMMGSPESDKDAKNDEKPQHRVRITRPFYLGKYEVTQAQYQGIMGKNPSLDPADPGKPVEKVSWLDAVEFCNKMGEKEGLKPFYEIGRETAVVPDWNGTGYRLPTDAEWEYACRAGTTTRYSFGDDTANLGEFSWFDGNSNQRTHVVGLKRANGFGLHDMHGNVWEWCWDWHAFDYFKEAPLDDPHGRTTGSSGRVVRGGSVDAPLFLLRSADRNDLAPDKRYGNQGFRLARAGGTGGSSTSAAESLSRALVDKPSISPATKTLETVTNTLGMKLTLIPAGEFWMGSPGSDSNASADEKPQHRVRISKSLHLGIHEVTQGQYQAVMGENPSGFKGSDELPVENVFWKDAVSFCNKLSAREGLKPCYRVEGDEITSTGDDGYRLPTEAEWEYACRAGSTTVYPFAVDAGALGEHAWYLSNSGNATHPVGHKRPNDWGLYDMLGNVWEWCADRYDQNYYASSPSPDPPGAARDSPRVLRGGGWHDDPRHCRPALRHRYAPQDRSVRVGFRVARCRTGEAGGSRKTPILNPADAPVVKPPARQVESLLGNHRLGDIVLIDQTVPAGRALRLPLGVVELRSDPPPNGAPGSFRIVAPFRTKSPVADGAIGPDEYGPPLAIDFTDDKNPGLDVFLAPNPAKSPKDLSADLYLAYTRDDLFVAVKVRDDVLIDRTDAAQPCFNDAVELFLDGDRLGGDLKPGGPEGFQIASTARGRRYANGVGTTDQDYVVKTSTFIGGYIVEFRIPLSTIDVADGAEVSPPGPGSSLRFNLAIVDNDKPVEGQERYCVLWSEDRAKSPMDGDGTWPVDLHLARRVKYELVAGPKGAAIDPETGLFIWDASKEPRTVRVTIRVRDSQKPEITSEASFTITTTSVTTGRMNEGGSRQQVQKTIANSIGMRLNLIPASQFPMGSHDDDMEAAPRERPQHRVRITRPFYLGLTEVTRGQFRRFVDDAGYRTEAEKDGKGGWGWNEEAKRFEENPRYTWQNPGFEQTDEHPVVNVSWNDAQAFIAWLGRLEGKTYRLPTEAEWEWSCRAGNPRRYFFGDNPEGLAAVGNIADGTFQENYPNSGRVTIAAHDGFVYTAPVGRFQRNAFGLYDMYGNVLEWCSDGYDSEYYKRSPMDDPPGAGEAAPRVLRGGGWWAPPQNCRSAVRHGLAPVHRSSDVGFRVARDQSETQRASNHSIPTEPTKTRPEGGLLLFNGENLDGWFVDSGLRRSWRVVAGDLVATGPGDWRKGGFLLSDRAFANFLLRFEFQPSPGARSGVTFRNLVNEFAGGTPNPLQIALLDHDRPGIKNGSFIWSTSPQGRAILPPERPIELKPAGSWNTMEVEVKGDSLRVSVNDQQVLLADLSELAERPGANPALRRQSGRIGFQSHSATVRFRNIALRELK